eukprot:3709403-Pyramimonas_sp.AAC.1
MLVPSDGGQSQMGREHILDVGANRMSVSSPNARCSSPQTVALLKRLFDVETYRAAMLEFEIDTARMPLGKISLKHVENGFKLLGEIQRLLAGGEEEDPIEEARRQATLNDASNRFNTVVPHSRPTVIDTEALLTAK